MMHEHYIDLLRKYSLVSWVGCTPFLKKMRIITHHTKQNNYWYLVDKKTKQLAGNESFEESLPQTPKKKKHLYGSSSLSCDWLIFFRFYPKYINK